MHKFIIIMLASTFSLYCENYIYRDIKTPPIKLKTNDIIILVSPFRTGSTLIYNILKYLFEDKAVSVITKGGVSQRRVYKTHNFETTHKLKKNNTKQYIVTTIRHPLNAAASLLATKKNHTNKQYIGNKKNAIYNLKNTYINIFHNLSESHNPENTTCLFYEHFENNFDYIFEKLETFFKVTIPKKEKDFIRNTFNKKAVIEHIKHLKDFSKYNHQTHFHGNHINNSSFSAIKDEEIKQQLRDILRDPMKLWRYEPF